MHFLIHLAEILHQCRSLPAVVAHAACMLLQGICLLPHLSNAPAHLVHILPGSAGKLLLPFSSSQILSCRFTHPGDSRLRIACYLPQLVGILHQLPGLPAYILQACPQNTPQGIHSPCHIAQLIPPFQLVFRHTAMELALADGADCPCPLLQGINHGLGKADRRTDTQGQNQDNHQQHGQEHRVFDSILLRLVLTGKDHAYNLAAMLHGNIVAIILLAGQLHVVAEIFPASLQHFLYYLLTCPASQQAVAGVIHGGGHHPLVSIEECHLHACHGTNFIHHLIGARHIAAALPQLAVRGLVVLTCIVGVGRQRGAGSAFQGVFHILSQLAVHRPQDKSYGNQAKHQHRAHHKQSHLLLQAHKIHPLICINFPHRNTNSYICPFAKFVNSPVFSCIFLNRRQSHTFPAACRRLHSSILIIS